MDTSSTIPPRHPDPLLGQTLTPTAALGLGYTAVVSPLEHAGPQFWTFVNVVSGERHYIIVEGPSFEVMCLTNNRRVVTLVYRELERRKR